MWRPLQTTLDSVQSFYSAARRRVGLEKQRTPARTYRLRFTGTCDEAEFRARYAEQPYWYHSFYFDNGFAWRGEYDIGRDVAGYAFPEDMSGMSVLDVGTGSGWFAAYFEQQGADVTTVDIRGQCELDWFGRPGSASLAEEKPAPDRVLPDGQPVYYSFASRGFWIMKDMLGLKARYVNGRADALSPALFNGQKFDLVFLGSLLMHLRDPIGALTAARSVCRQLLIATSLRLSTHDDDPLPLMALLAPSSHPTFWWQPNRACLREWFRAAGFADVAVDRCVRLSVDKPWIDDRGRSTACDQSHYLVHARV
jgi:SAM-dependent methyltransferase